MCVIVCVCVCVCVLNNFAENLKNRIPVQIRGEHINFINTSTNITVTLKFYLIYCGTIIYIYYFICVLYCENKSIWNQIKIVPLISGNTTAYR